MIHAPVPPNEAERLADVRALALLDTGPEERFDRITLLAQRIAGTPIAYIALVDDQRQWFKAKCGFDTDETGRSISFCAHTILEKEPTVVPDALTDPRFQDNPLVVGEPGIRFYVGIPLAGPRGYAVGTLCVADTQPRARDSVDLDALSWLAQMAQRELNLSDLVLIQKELLTTQTALLASHAQQAAELKEAARYVRSLIPPAVTSGPVRIDWSYEACSELGGDILGHLELPDGRRAIYLVDVMGHGVGAALHGSSIQAALRTRSLPGADFADPLQVFTALDARFPMADHDRRYFSMFYATLDPARGRLRYVNAGHPPGLLLQPDGRLESLQSTAPLVGLGLDIPARGAECQLEPGAQLWLYSDGATELPDEGGEELGTEGLVALLSGERAAPPTPATVEHQLRALAGPEGFDDDLSLLALTWPGPVAGSTPEA